MRLSRDWQFSTNESFLPNWPGSFRALTTHYVWSEWGGTPHWGVRTLARLQFFQINEYNCIHWWALRDTFGATPRLLVDDPHLAARNPSYALDGHYAWPLARSREWVTELVVQGPIRQRGCAGYVELWQHAPY